MILDVVMLTSTPSTTNLRVLFRVLLCSLESWQGSHEAKLSLSAKNPWVTRSVAHRPPGSTALAPPREDVTVHRPLALSFSILGPEYLNLYPFLSAPGLQTLPVPSPGQLPVLTHTGHGISKSWVRILYHLLAVTLGKHLVLPRPQLPKLVRGGGKWYSPPRVVTKIQWENAWGDPAQHPAHAKRWILGIYF